MKIESITVSSNISIENKKGKTKNDFSESLKRTNILKTKEEIEAYIDEIKSLGTKIVKAPNYSDVANYKKKIKEYLKSVVEYTYDLNKNTSFWEDNYFKTVKTVNKKLEEMTRELIYEQKDNIDLAAKIEEINGLLIDIYV